MRLSGPDGGTVLLIIRPDDDGQSSLIPNAPPAQVAGGSKNTSVSTDYNLFAGAQSVLGGGADIRYCKNLPAKVCILNEGGDGLGQTYTLTCKRK